MTTKVYKWDFRKQEYDLCAELHEDGTVFGDGHVATRLRYAVQIIEAESEDPADWYESIRRRLIGSWDNGYYRVDLS